MRRVAKLALAVALATWLTTIPLSSGAGGRSDASAATPRLAYSSASNSAIQPQPAPGSCHALGSGRYSRPDPRCTPGALNPQVTQATIGRTICKRGWTARVRPPEGVTEAEKRASMAAYGDHGSMGDYEFDHFVPLELGGATNDPRNLWPEPGGSPNPKDAVEQQLSHQVCDGHMSLARAQRAIVANWVVLAKPSGGTPGPPTRTTPPPPASASCSVSAAYSTQYSDWDVYVHSTQPDTNVTVTGAGTSASWHTDSTGYADVYLRASRSATGEQVTVRVGSATCSTAL